MESEDKKKKKYEKPQVESAAYLEKSALGCSKSEIDGFIPEQCQGQESAS